MKLIEAEKAKDVIHEYFKSLMVNGASGTDVDRLAVGIGSCLKHDANLLKAIDELPSAEQDTTTHDSIPAENGRNDGDRTSGDCISRQQAIDALLGITAMRNTIPLDSAIFNIKKLPSAQPDIIRCKDCKWYGRADKRRFYRGMDCLQKRIDTIVPDRDFCSRAERKKNGL